MFDFEPSAFTLSSSEPAPSSPFAASSSDPSISTSSEPLGFLGCCGFSFPGEVVSGGSGTWTESGNGDVGNGFCDAKAVPWKLALVGVVASSTGSGGWGWEALVGVGVVREARFISLSLFVASSFVGVGVGDRGVLTGRKDEVMAGCGGWKRRDAGARRKRRG